MGMAGDDVRGYPPRRTPPAGVRPTPPPRRFAPQPPHVYKRRRRVAVLLLVLFVLLFIRACVPSEHDREMKAWREQANQALEQPLDVGEEIAPSRPVEMRIPSLDMTATFDDKNCRVDGGAIVPASVDRACAFTADDRPYVLPGTSSGDIVVLAGDGGGAGTFRSLGDERSLTPGASMYLKTRESGDRWLKYQVTDLHEPYMGALPDTADIWGNVPMPGRLLTIARAAGTGSSEGDASFVVAGWQLQGVADRPE